MVVTMSILAATFKKSLKMALIVLAALSLTGHRCLADDELNDDKVSDLESEISYRVIGGEVAADGAWPWQIALYARKSDGNYQNLCGGSIFNKDWVMTAAHCVVSVDPGSKQKVVTEASALRIVESTSQIDRVLSPKSRGKVIAIERVIAHEDYDPARTQNDIALLKLASSASSTPIPPAFPEGSTVEIPGKIATITGWGAVRPYDPKTYSDPITGVKLRPFDPKYFLPRLQQAELPIIDCKRAPWQNIIDHRNLCTLVEEGKKSSCQGDSGGPLVVRKEDGGFVLVGVTSFGGNPCNSGPSVFSRVSAFQGWIEAKSGLKFSDLVGKSVPKPNPPPQLPRPSPKPPGTADEHNNSAGLAVSFVEGDTLKVGQSAQFRVTTRKPGYLVLLDVTPDRKVTQIFPNARSLSTPTGGRARSNFVDPAKPLLIPDRRNPYEGFEFKTEEPVGEGKLVAILSKKPLKSVSVSELPKSLTGAEAMDFLANLTGELRQDLELQADAKGGDWSFATRKYEIVP
jgi:secreted trypsin-like serine protease